MDGWWMYEMVIHVFQWNLEKSEYYQFRSRNPVKDNDQADRLADASG